MLTFGGSTPIQREVGLAVETGGTSPRRPQSRRDGILQAVAFAAERLLLSRAWELAVGEVLARLGEAAEASRAYITRNVVDADSHDRAQRLAEWCAPGVASRSGSPIVSGTSWNESGFERWVALMRRGEPIESPVDRLPAPERSALEAQDVRSIAAFPVAVDGGWWGLIGFDDREEAREWTGAEHDALRTAANVLGAAIQRQRLDERATKSEARYRALIEHIPAIAYVESLGGDPEHFCISPQVRGAFGYPPEEWRFTRG